LERLPAGSITTWEDLITRFLAQFFPPGGTAKLRNEILILEGLLSNFMAFQDARLSKFEVDFKQQQSEMTNKIDTMLKAITDRMAGALPSDTVKKPKLNVNPTTSVLFPRSYPTKDPQCSTHTHSSINTITIHPKQ
ncbi:hypothetical protein Tco_0037347, partial [Tanacetum coccineum]